MLADNLIEHGVLGVSRSIHGLNTRHPSGYRASRDAPMPTDGYAWQGVPAPGFIKRIGEVVDQRRGTDFQELRSKNLMNRGSGTATAVPGPLTNTLGPPSPRRETSRLSADLARARDSGQEVAIGAATDPYQPAETRFRVTRAVLEAMRGVPGLRIGITTKSASTTRTSICFGRSPASRSFTSTSR
jgi:hypothetical protein